MSGMALDPLRGLLWQPCNKLLQHYFVDNLLNVASLGHQSSEAGIPELLSHHKGSAIFPKALAVLLWVKADPLKDGSSQVVVHQEVLN